MAAPAQSPPWPSYGDLMRVPGARAFVLAGFLGRLPMSTLTLGFILLIVDRRHSFALAGAVSATLICAGALGSPVLGAMADRIGQRPVLLACIPQAVALSVLIVLILKNAATWTLFPAAIMTGGLLPPVSSLQRARWTFLIGGGTSAAERAYALEAVLDEMVFIAGPVLIATLSAATTPVSALACSALFALLGCLSLAAQRRTQPPLRAQAAETAGALRCRGVSILCCCTLLLAIAFGIIDTTIVGYASHTSVAAYSGLLLACVAAGSATSAIWYGRVTWKAPLHRRFLIGGAALIVSTAPLCFTPTISLMIPLAFFAGSAISPALIAAFGLLERLVPAHVLTEGFTWVSTALTLGAGIGVAISGQAIDAIGVGKTFLLAPTAALLSVLVGLTGLKSLRVGTAPPAAVYGRAYWHHEDALEP
jgi:MFS family permease